ncbi:hypothetical protein BDK51DRAFT_34189 [Blyttiomyces helicus]|uniref:SAP domain-containing protein n=1 Tax=Blyttiomyces helicus TaxID=388810 RepID=A0A4P9WHM5_9FUNG|nr:hypothetical protein BDK51DRAFT_34189 [Blyttiomyces helicus]|eukprot:RKO91892.1 hypothetical protein BDK51DRAFT_34189 [Blyttiomyces helicus]
MSSAASWKKLRVTDLREELSKLGLETSGNKNELIDRLIAHSAAQTTTPTAATTAPAAKAPANPTPAPAQAPTAAASKPAAIVTAPSAATTAASKTSPATPLSGGETEAERREARAKRFGLAAPTSAPATKAPVLASINSAGPPVSAAYAAMSEEERRKARATRFGPAPVVVTGGASAAGPATAAAPGSAPTADSTKTLIDGPKSAPVGKAPAISIDPEVLKKRIERFGVVNPTLQKVVVDTEENAKKRSRLERFGMVGDAEARKKTKQV